MTVAKYTRPNFTTQLAASYKANIDSGFAVFERFNSWFAPHENDTGSPAPDMSIRIDAGLLLIDGVLTQISAQVTPQFSAPVAGSRIDRVVLDPTDGDVAIIQGVAEAGSPAASPPDIPGSKIPICRVMLSSTDTAITNDMIVDERWFDASLIRFARPASGAVPRSMLDRELDIVSAADFGFLTTATAAVNKAALVAAIAAVSTTNLFGGEIYIPRADAVYPCDPNITITHNTNHGVTIRGSSAAFGYNNSQGGSKIQFTTDAAGYGFKITDVAGNSGPYLKICNLAIDGNGVLGNGIIINGQATLEDVHVQGCTSKAILLEDFINQTYLHRVSAAGNTGAYGLYVGEAGVAGNNSIFGVENCVFRQNLIGVYIEDAENAVFRNCVIEANTNEGLKIDRRNNKTVRNLCFDTCWFEANWSGGGGSDYGVVITAQTLSTTDDEVARTGAPSNLQFVNCKLDTAPGGALNVICCIDSEFKFCRIVGAITLGANTNGLGFIKTDYGGVGTLTNNNAGTGDTSYIDVPGGHWASSTSYKKPGEWTTPTFAAGTYHGDASMTWTVASGDVTTFQYTINHKMMTVNFDVRTSTVGGTPAAALQITIPASRTAAKTSPGACWSSDNGGTLTASICEVEGGGNINLYTTPAKANWTASTDTTAVRGSITFEIN